MEPFTLSKETTLYDGGKGPATDLGCIGLGTRFDPNHLYRWLNLELLTGGVVPSRPGYCFKMTTPEKKVRKFLSKDPKPLDSQGNAQAGPSSSAGQRHKRHALANACNRAYNR